ncbi:MAG: hypothetical protein OEX02_07730 [Cyclobacteriaceae bacterium]|nr:hypothetical protein [Cyclobacteriaceae bacterium]
MNAIIKSAFIIFCSLLVSCQCNCEYPYKDNLTEFLSTEANYKIPQGNVILVILPLDACSSCLLSTIEMLKNSHDELDIVVATSSKRNLKNFGLENLSGNIYFDLKNNYSRYEIGAGVPLIFHFKNGECLFYSETTDDKKSQIKKHFKW